ncbi:MAG: hypothetical protein IT428_18745, partial [Planctomycetaceae bacterium]|nr:hypothetical protein [Planctomycetaceae bacterium]
MSSPRLSLITVFALGVLSVAAVPSSAADAKGVKKPFSTGSTDVLVEFINEKIAQGWSDNEIEPSEVADDS